MVTFITENWSFLQENLWPSMAMFILFVICLAILAFDKTKSARRIFWYSVIVLAGVVYNPYFWYVFVNGVYEGDDLVQLRLPWLVPAFLIMAYAMCKMISYAKCWQGKVAGGVTCVVLIYCFGTPFHPDLFVEPQNIYKISEDAKESADDILTDMREHPNHLKERPEVMEFNTSDYREDITPANLYHYGLRQYTSEFTVHPAIVEEETYMSDGFDVTGYYNQPKQYMVYESQAESVGSSAEKYGYKEFARTDDHVLMRYFREATVYLVIRGQTLSDTSGELRGNSGTSSLTTTGWWRILEVGELLSNIKFSAVYASETGQSQKTANIILRMNDNHDTNVGVGAISALNDILWGKCEGWKVKDVIAEFGEEALFNGEIGDGLYVSPIGAESKYSAVQRYDRGMGDSVKRLQENGLNILVVANPSISWWISVFTTGGNDYSDMKPGDCLKLQFIDGEWIAEGLIQDEVY